MSDIGDRWGPTLAATVAGSGPRLVLVHGFTQNRRCWGSVAPDLRRDHELVCVDAPGHGDSGHATASLWEAAALLGRTGGPAVYVGYSMGGRMCLHLALAEPGVVRGLILIGATAGIEDPDARRQRQATDETFAAHLEQDGLGPFLDRWLAQPLFAGLGPDNDQRQERLGNDPVGLAASLRHAGTGTQEPLWGRLHEIDVPVLLLAGADDARFARIARRIATAIGEAAQVAEIDGAGHTAHLEQPERFVAAVRPWLAAHGL